ncbi:MULTISPECIES: hypothetical protein [Listeria]|uniref:hypothetical protein n=1 Tax=Listeria TaxID=1637 RepID=UPI000B593CA3|nr:MULTISPECIES: hypothetical protein [Listeria]
MTIMKTDLLIFGWKIQLENNLKIYQSVEDVYLVVDEDDDVLLKFSCTEKEISLIRTDWNNFVRVTADKELILTKRSRMD